MIDLQFDFSDFERRAQEIGAALDQVPFALSQALNDAVKVARTTLIEETWPKHVQVRNRSFMKAALRMEFATKRNLRVVVKDVLGRGNLLLHAQGGTRTAQGKQLAIPSPRIAQQRGARGVPQRLRPRNLKNAFRRGDVILQRVGKGKNKHLELAYVLEPSVHIQKDVPFVDDFIRVMRREVTRSFPERIQAAMASRRPRR